MSQKKYDTKRFKQLAGILSEQMFPMASPAPLGNPFGKREPEPEVVESSEWSDEDKSYLLEYVAHLRALHLWFHSAHHVTKGASFAGDHVDLYGKIYTEIQEEIDGAIEKAVGVTNDEDLACPLKITENALAIMEEFECPPGKKGSEIAAKGLEFEKAYVEFLEHLFKVLETKDLLSLGMNDQLAASANKHEEYVYLLQQRVKSARTMPESQEKANTVLKEGWLDDLEIM